MSEHSASASKRSPIVFRALKLARGLCLAFGDRCIAGSIAFCIGSGGTGKSSLAKHVAKAVYGDSSTWAVGAMPVIIVGADTVERGFFTTKSLIRSLLCSLHDPFRSSISAILGWSIEEDVKQRLIDAIADEDVLDSSESTMREAFVELAKLLQVKLIIVDEANLLVITQRGRMPTDFIESIRRLGDRIGCAILFFGTVDMLELMEYSGQVNRRKLKIHLDRMKCFDQEGKDEFASFLGELEGDFGVTQGLLTSHAGEVLAWTYGIPGEVVGLLERADMFREALQDPELMWTHVVMAKQHPVEIERMKWEADLIDNVMSGRPLTQKDRKEIERRRKNRMNPRRVPIGAQE